jgi:hypothetical protein
MRPSPGRHDRASVPTRAVGYWRADVANVPLGPAGCAFTSGTPTARRLSKQWDYWDNCGASVVSVAGEGLPPTPWQGDRVVKWQKSMGDNNVFQKLNRNLSRDNWPKGTGHPTNKPSPPDVSGRYIVYQYLPLAQLQLNPKHGWVVLNEFKENYDDDAAGGWHQDPTWGVICYNYSAGGNTKCALSAHGIPHQSRALMIGDVSDRWVKWEYRVYQGDKDTTGHGGRVELWVDDTLVDTGYNDEMHVGSGAFSPLNRTSGWIWIAGQYSSNQTTDGVPDYQNTALTSYVGLSTILPLS